VKLRSLEKTFREFCVVCGREPPAGFQPLCACGGMIDVAYDLANARLRDSDDSLERYFDLLPLVSSDHCFPEPMRATPCVHARRLGAELDLPYLYLKDESALPTGTTKDRMAAVALPYLIEKGTRDFCTSSTGNSSTSYARLMQLTQACHLHLFTAERFLHRVDCTDSPQVTHYGLRDATFVEAFEQAGRFARRHGYTSERGFFNPGRREGLKLAFLEAAEQIPAPVDWYVQAVSSAMGVVGTFKGAKELCAMGLLPRPPRLLCVQQDGCNPMARAFRAGSAEIRPQDIVERPTGIADAILRGNPTRAYPHVRRNVLESGGGILDVCESEIREARHLIEDLEGLSPCFSASAAFAGLMRGVREGLISGKDTLLVSLTGSDRKRDGESSPVRWLARTERGWEPEDREP
jgi:threonine synthase